MADFGWLRSVLVISFTETVTHLQMPSIYNSHWDVHTEENSVLPVPSIF